MDAVRMDDVSTGLLTVCTQRISVSACPEEACFMFIKITCFRLPLSQSAAHA